MTTVKVLIEGYARVNSDGTWDATCTTTFIDTGNHKVIMDPGCNRELLLSALQNAGLKVGDIDYVFISHYHPDHCLLMGIFPKATVFDSLQYQQGPMGGETGDHLPDTDIKIIKTPGHAPEHASLLVPTSVGHVLIAADVFWWPDGVDQKVDLDLPDDFASDQLVLKSSRASVLALTPDLLIIPGHGKPFKVEDQR